MIKINNRQVFNIGEYIDVNNLYRWTKASNFST